MRRLYFLLPTLQSAKTVVDELLLARVDSRHIHVMAREGTSLADLPEATLFQKTDLAPSLARGITFGGLSGLAACTVAVLLYPSLAELGGGALMGVVVLSAVLGAWIASMIGINVRSSRLQQFESAIDAGQFLLMVDVSAHRVDEIHDAVQKHHPEAVDQGTEPTIPAFP